MLRLKIAYEPAEPWMVIPSHWGLAALDRFAASIALGKGVPGATPYDQPPASDEIREYWYRVEDEDLAFQSLLYTPEGVYLASGSSVPAEFQPDEVGDLDQFRAELRTLAGHLGLELPPRLDLLEAELGKVPYGLERYCCGALFLAADAAAARESNLTFETFYVPGVGPDSFPYHYRDIVGFGRLSEAVFLPHHDALEIEFPNGFRYRIPLPALVATEFVPAGDWLAAQVTSDRYAAELSGSGGQTAEVSAMKLLLLAEPGYEGYDDDEKEWVRPAQERFGPFRLFPP